MCGIFGLIEGKTPVFSPGDRKDIINRLILLSESRGKEASGVATVSSEEVTVCKAPVTGSELIKTASYRILLNRPLRAVIGHSRLATNGPEGDNRNNQPVISGDSAGIHNGIIVNDEHLIKKFGIRRKSCLDTEVLVGLFDLFVSRGYSFNAAVSHVFALIEGSASVALVSSSQPFFTLATNTGSLYILTNRKPGFVLFASERYILERVRDEELEMRFNTETITQVAPGTGCVVNIDTGRLSPFAFATSKERKPSRTIKSDFAIPISDISPYDGSFSVLEKPLNTPESLGKHHPDYKTIYSLKRCAKCILPDTMPFISFDRDGVCNYCHEYEKIRVKGSKALEEAVAPYRRHDGRPDVIVAFSGGRDSSFGLHFVKTVLHMNPIAYTYDWGMVTDLARRNEARLVGKLGVEHVIVSADIREKRDHIRRHILAWLKRPTLGMVPLFMEGDKQAEYYVEELKRKTGIRLVIYCRGNKLEDERFKFSHAGIYDGTPNGVIHNLSPRGKIQLASYYFKEYLLNPAYINASLPDTLLAYFALYLQKHNFLYLWQYIPWNEQQIISTIKQEYDWETASDSVATWRTDDGTAPFYNYIYYSVQGLTEHDGFRSNQIREGMITRTHALTLVHEENKPRFDALAWYFNAVGLDGDMVLSQVDTIPTLFKAKL